MTNEEEFLEQLRNMMTEYISIPATEWARRLSARSNISGLVIERMSGPPLGYSYCLQCRSRIDPELCHCGNDLAAHQGIAEDGASPVLGHTFIPAGCSCGYGKRI